MVMCFAPDCKHYSERGECKQFFRFPKNHIEKQRWIKLVRRQDRDPGPYSVICSCHFKNNDKAQGPTIFLHNIKKQFTYENPIKKKKTTKKKLSPVQVVEDVTPESHEEPQPGPSGFQPVEPQPGPSGLQQPVLSEKREIGELRIQLANMPRFCAVLGCGNRSDREHDKNFFFFPRCKDTHGRVIQDNVKKRDLWVEALYRRDFTEKHLRSAYVCSDHFVSGRPSTDPTNEDYVPSVHMGYETKTFLPVFGRRGRRKRARTEKKMSKSREYCSVPYCSSSRKKNPSLMFHQFPKKDEKMLTVDDFGNKLIIERRLIWTINLQMWRRVKRHMKVCSLHFLDSDYQRSGWSSKRTLCSTAIPSQSLPYNNNVTGKRKKVPGELLDLRPYRQEKSMANLQTCKLNRIQIGFLLWIWGMEVLEEGLKLRKHKGLSVNGRRIPGVHRRGCGRDRELQRQRRETWINALQRADLTETKIKYARICSIHFHTGKPAALDDVNSPDWVPSLRMGYCTSEDNKNTAEQDEGCSYLGTGETVIVNHAGDSITLSNNPISWEEEEHLTVFDTERDVEYLKKEADFLKIQLEVKNDELREVREELSLVKSEYKKSRNLLKSFCIHNNKRGKLFV